jgi:multidrug efflux system outer membrane protein
MRRSLIALAGATMLAGCNLAPENVRPAAPVPAAFPSGAGYAPADAAATAGLPWRSLVSDSKLVAVIEQALANNRDLRVAAANVASARAQYRVQRSSQMPTLSAGADASIGESGVSQFGAAGVTESYAANVGIGSFEIDLFGRLGNLSTAAFETYLATESGARSTRITLIGETASAYATLAADRDLLRVSQETLASAERSLGITAQLNDAGLSGKLDVRQAETIVAQARSDVETYTTLAAQDRNALDLLVGAPIDDTLLPISLAALEQGVGRVPVGLSSEVLLGRPDVVEAEHQLRAANANIGAARAAFFPTISLTSVAGLASTALSSLFTGGAFAWSVAPSVALPIFGGANPGNLDYAKAQRDLFVAQYEKAVQTAFREVADGLARAGTIDRQRAAQAALVTASDQSYQLANQRYRGGIDTFLTTLDAQRTLYTARRTAIATELEAVTNRITLYRVIGSDG